MDDRTRLKELERENRELRQANHILCKAIWRLGLWRNAEQVQFATMERVDCFNNRRPLEPIGNIPATEAEARY
jgi:hypothetical protein